SSGSGHLKLGFTRSEPFPRSGSLALGAMPVHPVMRGRPEVGRLPATVRFAPPSVFLWWELGQQVRPVASDDAAYFVIHGADVVELLDLLADHLELFRAERPAV